MYTGINGNACRSLQQQERRQTGQRGKEQATKPRLLHGSSYAQHNPPATATPAIRHNRQAGTPQAAVDSSKADDANGHASGQSADADGRPSAALRCGARMDGPPQPSPSRSGRAKVARPSGSRARMTLCTHALPTRVASERAIELWSWTSSNAETSRR